MLALDDPRWGKLEHAYGPATDVPRLLRALESSPQPTKSFEEEPWYSLWSCLCHQDDAYTASYAAVPHLVRIALTASRPIDFSFFLLPTSIEIARRTGRAPELPPELAEAYLNAISDLGDLARRHGDSSADQAMRASAAAAIAAANGDIDAAEKLLDPDDA